HRGRTLTARRGRSPMKSRPRTASATFFIGPTIGRAFSAVSTPPRTTPFRFIAPTTLRTAIAAPIHGRALASRLDALSHNPDPPQRLISPTRPAGLQDCFRHGASGILDV